MMKKKITCFFLALAFCANVSAFAGSTAPSASTDENAGMDLVLHDFVTYAQGYCEGLRETGKVPFKQCLDQTVSLELFLLEEALQPAPNTDAQARALPGFSQKA